MREIRRIAVIGGGTMGGGIAALCARKGLELIQRIESTECLEVLVSESTRELAERAERRVYARFEKWQHLGKVGAPDVVRLQNTMRFTGDRRSVVDFAPDLVIEAIVEERNAKHDLFKMLDNRLKSEVIFASNTSTIPITELAGKTDRGDKFIGMHFFNPPTTMPLVEIIPGGWTSGGTVDAVTAFAQSVLGKTTIQVKDQPGFLVNRLLLPYLTEAALVVEEGGSFRAIDATARDMGWPMGPFQLLDTIGIDIALSASKNIARHERDTRPEPELFEFMAEENRLGSKVGSGFYKTADGQQPLEPMLGEWFPNRGPVGSIDEVYRQRILGSMLREAVISLENGVASAEDIETGAQLGIGCPRGGPLHIVDDWGADELVESLTFLEYLGQHFSVPGTLYDMAEENKAFFSSW